MEVYRADHRCGSKPDSVSVTYCGSEIPGWCVSTYGSGYKDYDERTYMKLHVEFSIAYCPFCGKKLPDYSKWETDE